MKLRAVLNKSWEQHLTKQNMYGHLLPITQTFGITEKDRTISQVMFCYGVLLIDTPVLAELQNLQLPDLSGHWIPSRGLLVIND